MGSNKLIFIDSGLAIKSFLYSGICKKKSLQPIFTPELKDVSEEFGGIVLPQVDIPHKLSLLYKLDNFIFLFNQVEKKGDNAYSLYFKVESYVDNFIYLLGFTLSKLNCGYLIKYLISYVIRKSQSYKLYLKVLKNNHPKIVILSHQRSTNAAIFALAARDIGAKTICFINSWDNIPKGVMRVESDYYILWSNFMLEEVKSHYGSTYVEKSLVLGTPQFDYVMKDYSDETNSSFDDEILYILFTANDNVTGPYDHIYLEDLISEVRKLNTEGNFKHSLKIILRINPVNPNPNFSRLSEINKDILKNSEPLWMASNNWKSGYPMENDSQILKYIISKSFCVINIGSTICMDAAYLNTPTIFIKYNSKNITDLNWDIDKIYQYVHLNNFRNMGFTYELLRLEDLESIFLNVLNGETPNLFGLVSKYNCSLGNFSKEIENVI
ncbi:MAG: hypothetical protein ACPGR7_00345 [Flavobacteriaceae bacterium]